MKRLCMLTGIEFDTRNPEDNISPVVKEQITKLFLNDDKIRKEIIATLVQDSEVMTEVAKSVLSCMATDVGLNYPGTVGEFFLRFRDRAATKGASKIFRGTRKVH